MGVGIWCRWGCLDGHVWPGLDAGLEVRCLSCIARFGGVAMRARLDIFSLCLSSFLLLPLLSLYSEEDIVIVVSCAVLLF